MALPVVSPVFLPGDPTEPARWLMKTVFGVRSSPAVVRPSGTSVAARRFCTALADRLTGPAVDEFLDNLMQPTVWDDFALGLHEGMSKGIEEALEGTMLDLMELAKSLWEMACETGGYLAEAVPAVVTAAWHEFVVRPLTERDPRGLSDETLESLSFLVPVIAWANDVADLAKVLTDLTEDEVAGFVDQAAAALIAGLSSAADRELAYIFALNPRPNVARSRALVPEDRGAALRHAQSAVNVQGKEIGTLLGIAVVEVALAIFSPV